MHLSDGLRSARGYPWGKFCDLTLGIHVHTKCRNVDLRHAARRSATPKRAVSPRDTLGECACECASICARVTGRHISILRSARPAHRVSERNPNLVCRAVDGSAPQELARAAHAEPTAVLPIAVDVRCYVACHVDCADRLFSPPAACLQLSTRLCREVTRRDNGQVLSLLHTMMIA